MANDRDPLVFVNYRRDDSRYIAGLIADELVRLYGPRAVFFDANGIGVGSVWPDQIRRALERATVVLAVMGPSWLRAVDEFGRRRIDDPDDWVRKEIEHAFKRNLEVIPTLVDGLEEMLPAKAFPPSLARLAERQAAPAVRKQSWRDDVCALARKLKQFGFSAVTTLAPKGPDPLQRERKTLDDAQVAKALGELRGWQMSSKEDPRAHEGLRVELFRRYDFPSFESAIEFMAARAAKIASRKPREQHHPYWRNEWKSLFVWFTTWDVGYRITELDVIAAEEMEHHFQGWAKRAK